MNNQNQNLIDIERPRLYFDVLSLYNVALLVAIDDNDNKYLVANGVVSAKFGDKISLVSNQTFKNEIMKGYQMVGFNSNRYADYIAYSILNNQSSEQIYTLSEKINSTFTPAYKMPEKPKSLFGTFDITSVFGSKASTLKLEELGSQLGYDIENYVYDEESKLNVELYKNLVCHLVKRVQIIKAVANTKKVYGKYITRIRQINKYLPGKNFLISLTDAQVATRIITSENKNVVTLKDMKKKFTWNLNGHYVLDLIPEQWKSELLTFSSTIEEYVQGTFINQAQKSQADFIEAKKDLKKFINAHTPNIDNIEMNEHFIVKPKIGGLHSEYTDINGNQIVADFKDVHHRDISGAYGWLALLTNLYGKATPMLKQVIADKMEAKRIFKETGDDTNVEPTKLTPNAVSGESDRPGSPLYNPINMIENRIMLQILLFQAGKIVIKYGGQPLSINTDGLMYTGNEELIAPAFEKWHNYWGLDLGYDHMDHYIGKDDSTRIVINNNQIVEASGDVAHRAFNPFKLGELPKVVDNVVVDLKAGAERTHALNLTVKELSERNLISDKIINSLLNDTKFSMHLKLVDLYRLDIVNAGFMKKLLPIVIIDLLVEKYTLVNNAPELFIWTKKAEKNHLNVINYEIIQDVNRFFVVTDGQELNNYNIKTDSLDKVKNMDSGTKVKIINNSLSSKLPDNIDLNAYKKLIHKRLW